MKGLSEGAASWVVGWGEAGAQQRPLGLAHEPRAAADKEPPTRSPRHSSSPLPGSAKLHFPNGKADFRAAGFRARGSLQHDLCIFRF